MSQEATVVAEVHCALPTCRTLDFLPLTCPHCSRSFCREHASPTAHACPSDPALARVSSEELARAGHESRIEVRDLLPDPKRHKSLHVNQDDPARQAVKAKQVAALDKLRASFSKGKTANATTASGTTASGSSAAPKPPNPALELMRLKQKAVPADPKHTKRPGDVSMPDRLYFTLAFVDSDGSRRADVKSVWIAKTISAGKALDLFADLFKVDNVNNTTTDPAKVCQSPSALLHHFVVQVRSPYDVQRLSLLIDQESPAALVLPQTMEGQIANGGALLLRRGPHVA
ncbi:hypothetical protein BMF94_4516 [Rhodotorula taiwanensis]|uniref:AN1-type domain-containing protein n=1 Tax=Rhodotorula taiwanensis TaxID=741276 RepID=A0A2S5B7E4_9BASI|nr:hypothetical protein BMF94_4516 [Rhodotorula taiwanensis]